VLVNTQSKISRGDGATALRGSFVATGQQPKQNYMQKHITFRITAGAAAMLAASALVWQLQAAEAKNVIKDAMKTYHKAPKGVDPVCKKATDGKASPEELTKLVECYAAMAAAKPPQGDEASWKDKTGKLLAAAQSLQKGEAGAVAKYKDAVNCKACHNVHKPQ
jgi:hypothetical protein